MITFRINVALRVLLGAFVSLAAVAPAAAHPHVWIKATSELVYAPDGSVTGIRQHWAFDDMYSAFAVQGLASKEKGKFTRAELAPLATVNMKEMKEAGYFTFVTADGKKTPFADPLPDYGLDYKNEMLTLSFTLPFKQPLKAKDVTVELYDPTYFIAFELEKPAPVHLVDAPAQCKLAVEWPREMTYALGKQLSNNPEAATNFGSYFANKITVKCP